MPEITPKPTFGAGIFYQDAKAAIEWLESAFSFETALLVEEADGRIGYSEMVFGNGYVMPGSEWFEPAQLGPAQMKSPASADGANTQGIAVELAADLDGHCERARAAAAIIVQEPADQPYGARTYRAVDPEGHEWAFAQRLNQFSPADMTAAGMKVEHRLDEGPANATFMSQLFYRDVQAALAWLEKAFAFETSMVVENAGDVRAHMLFRDCVVALGNEGKDPAGRRRARLSPLTLGGVNTQSLAVELGPDLDEHARRAQAAGALITQAPADQPYGARTYRAIDVEGHLWTFAFHFPGG